MITGAAIDVDGRVQVCCESVDICHLPLLCSLAKGVYLIVKFVCTRLKLKSIPGFYDLC